MTPIEFSNLEKRSKTINQRSDELTAALSKIQEKLNSLNLGIEVFLDWSGNLGDKYEADKSEGADRICTATRLGYGKHGDKWGLLVKETSYLEWLNQGDVSHSEEKESHTYPLLSASRKVRMLALDKIEALVKALEEEADKLDEAVSRANEIANNL